MIKQLLYIIFIASLGLNLQAQEVNKIDKKGLKQGKWVKNHPNSQVKRYEGQFKDDQAIGKFIYYYPTGEIRSELVYTGKNRSRATYYFPDGSLMAIGVYEGQEKDSTWIFYSIYGEKIAEEYYVVGKKYGNFKKYHRNGKLLEERYFENNLENGKLRQYYENGNLSREAFYVNGSIEGPAKFYHPNGKVSFEGEYFKDTKNGIWKTYNEDGELIDERKYTKGVPEYRDSDFIKYDTSQFKRKEVLDFEDFVEEDYLAIPEDGKSKNKKKK